MLGIRRICAQQIIYSDYDRVKKKRKRNRVLLVTFASIAFFIMCGWSYQSEAQPLSPFQSSSTQEPLLSTAVMPYLTTFALSNKGNFTPNQQIIAPLDKGAQQHFIAQQQYKQPESLLSMIRLKGENVINEYKYQPLAYATSMSGAILSFTYGIAFLLMVIVFVLTMSRDELCDISLNDE